MKKYLVLLFLLILFSISKAQYFTTGQDPASLKWRQINTENFQLIYPDYYEENAQKLAGIMEAVYQKGGATLHFKPEKISIILHTQTVKSNGLVAWAPKRVEFYTIPHQGNYSQDWIEQLAIHEFRHVVQIDKVNSELPKIIKVVMGQQGTALVFGAYMPWWLIEGDAVVIETALSNSGRGRFPSFLIEPKALAVEKGNYKYDKAYNSSYKDYVPGHYELGYYLVGASRERYGADLWSSVMDNVGSKPFSLTPFNSALKKRTGFTKVQLYNSVFDSLRAVWIEEDKKYEPKNITVLSPEKETYTSYQYNHWLNDSTVISYKTALNEIPSFVVLKPGQDEIKILQPGIIFNESVNYRDNLMVWSEQLPDARWQHSGKSLIRLYNVESGRKEKIVPQFTAFAPSISPDKSRVVTVESDFSSNYYLSVYQRSDGALLNRFQAENNNYFFSPDWINNNEIVFVELTGSGKRLSKLNTETGDWKVLINEDIGEIQNLKVAGKYVYFVTSITGKDELYKFDFDTQALIHVYEPRFGLKSPAVLNGSDKILVSDYTADGYRVIAFSEKEVNTEQIRNIKNHDYILAQELAEQEPGVFDFSSAKNRNYPSKKYNKASHMFSFHSWAPAAIDANYYEISPGVSLLSQNKLGTADLNVGYRYKIDEKAGVLYAKYSYKGWYPIFDAELNTGKSTSKYSVIEQTKGPRGDIIAQDTVIKRFSWNETSFTANTRIPFNFSRGKFNRYFQPEIRYNFTLYNHNASTPDYIFNGNYQSLSYRLYYQQLLKQSYQDVYPDFGFATELLFRHSPFGDADLGTLKLGQVYLFLPGILPNHGIRLYSGIQQKNSRTFAESIRYPRGWGKTNTTKAYSFAFDYKLPLFYPEWNFGRFAYLQRVKSSFFADYAILNGNTYNGGMVVGKFQSNISSFGIELTGDTNILRFYAPVEIGFRASYLPDLNDVFFNLLFSVDFNSL